MNLKLPALKKLLSIALLAIGVQYSGQASHYMGADITYLCVSPNVYVVTGKIYRDCSGAGLSTSETLKWQSPGCNAGRTIPMPLVPGSVQTGLTMGLYCPATVAQAQCNSTATVANFETGTYRATVTFTAAEQNCPDWYFSMRMGNRPTIENIVNGQSAYLYSEAYLRLGSTINNNSPEFAPTNIPIPFVCVNADVILSMNASEFDADSLSYHLSTPLDDYNDPIPYASNTNPGIGLPAGASPPFIDPVTGKCTVYNTNVALACSNIYKINVFDPRPLPFQTAVMPASYCTGGGGPVTGQPYTANYPLPVAGLGIDWITGCKTNIQAAAGGFNLDPVTGVLRFRPTVFHPSAPISGRNKYAVVVQINEWRKINGMMTKVGHIRRDMLVLVNNCSNMMPMVNVPNPNPNTGSIFIQDTVFNMMCCTTTSFSIRHIDVNAADLLNVSFPDAVALGNGFFSFPNIPGLLMKPYTNNMNAVNIGFYMTPNSSTVGTDYYLRSIIKDNACPLNGRIEQTYRIHIIAGNRAAPVSNIRDITIGPGQSTPISINFQRPDSMIVNNVLVPAQYSYFWTETNASGGIPNGLNLAHQTFKNIVVSPTQATRYFLTITNPAAGCKDTTSVTVRIGSPAGTNDLHTNGISLHAYPNPFSDQVNFSLNLPKTSNGTIIIYNILGREADRIELNNLPAGEHAITWKNAGRQPAGHYVARFINEGRMAKTIKFTKLQ